MLKDGEPTLRFWVYSNDVSPQIKNVWSVFENVNKYEQMLCPIWNKTFVTMYQNNLTLRSKVAEKVQHKKMILG